MYVIILLIVLLFFYRYPIKKDTTFYKNGIYSPAYGTIMDIKINDNKIFIAIYLGLTDIHRQYSPVTGTVVSKKYDHTGKYNLAYNLNKSKLNEKMITEFLGDNGIVTVYQIAGKFVRRITSKVTTGDHVGCGQEIGMIHFGSRVDIIIPNADKFNLGIKLNQKVHGSNTLIGTFN
jgi:phosphatidylserine decarboxylase